MAYQIVSVSNLDSVNETFSVVYELAMIYFIDDDDAEVYQHFQKDDDFSFRSTHRKGRVKAQAPVLEPSNAIQFEIKAESILFSPC